MTSKEFTNIIRSVIREEIQMATTALKKEIIKEIRSTGNTVMNIDDVVEHRLLKDRAKQTTTAPVSRNPAHKLSNNPLLNDILNETKNNPSTPLQMDLTESMEHDSWPSMEYSRNPMVKPSPMSSMNNGVAKVNEMIPTVDAEGRPLRVSPDALPAGLQKALTRDYRSLVKSFDKK